LVLPLLQSVIPSPQQPHYFTGTVRTITSSNGCRDRQYGDIPVPLQGGHSTPELSASPMTSDSSQMRSGDDQLPPAGPDHYNIQQPVMLSSHTVDPDYHEFTRFGMGFGDSGPIAYAASRATPLDDWVPLETRDSDLAMVT
jgi:hypothetical protein